MSDPFLLIEQGTFHSSNLMFFRLPNIIVRFVSRRTRNNIYKERRKLKSNAPRKPNSERVFINENLTKRNKHLFSLANEEKSLTGNTFGPTMEEFFSDKAMTAELLLSEVKRTFNISKTLWTTLEISTKFLHLNQFENSPILPFDMVSGLHVISLSWCVVLNVFPHLFNNHGFVQNLWYAQLFALCSLFFMS